ncbi:MAG: PKD domain-containing protein [Bacteroidetes bacterium]|nr:PKD domain-containing protein [Bacteroidota bacterium]
MRRFNLLLCLLAFFLPAQSQQMKKVLFFGNSYTNVNNLPGLFAQVAKSQGDSVVYDQSTPGGFTFQMHTQNPVTPVLIAETDWDYVVLQEQSQLPSWPPDSVQNLVYPYADTLNHWVKAHDSCSTTLFYMTWGRRTGDLENCPWYPTVCTYDGMQGRLRESYLEMGRMFTAQVSPVGIAWQHTREIFPAIGLYAADGSHPSICGSYLAACTFYGVIFQKSPVGAWYPAPIPSDTAQILQQIAWHTVFDSISVWYIDTTKVHAGFTAEYLGGGTFRFTNTSLNATRYAWDFGDQGSSTDTDPVHTYAAPGSYLVTLTAGRQCDTSSFARQQTVVSIDCQLLPGEPVLYPNPSTGIVYVNPAWLKLHSPANFTVTDQQGNLILKGTLGKGNPCLSLSAFAKGVYHVRIETSNEVFMEGLVLGR